MPTLLPAPAIRVFQVLGRVVLGCLFWGACLALIGLNAWWWWDARPAPELVEVARWVGSPRNEEAESVLQRIIRQSPHYGEARLLLAKTLGIKKDTRGFAEQAHQVPFWSRVKPEALYGEGMAWQELNHARFAERAFRQYLAADPNHPEQSHSNQANVVERLLNLYALEDRWEEVRALLVEAYEDESIGPVKRRSWLVHLMRTYLERSDPSVAVVVLRKNVAADPEDWDAWLALARATGALKLYEESDHAFDVVLQARPRDPRAWSDRLGYLLARRDFEGLARAIAAAPPEAETNGQFWFVRGRHHEIAYTERGLDRQDLAAAAEAFRRAVLLLPDDPQVHFHLGFVEQRLGHATIARAHQDRHAELMKLGADLPLNMNAYMDAVEARTIDPVKLKAIMGRFITLCQGLGMTKEAEFWGRERAAM